MSDLQPRQPDVRPVNRPARQALAIGALLAIVAALALMLIALHGHPPGG